MSEGTGESSRRRVGDRIIVGGVIVGVASVIMKFSSLIWRQSVSKIFGTSATADDYFFAFNLVIMVFLVFQQSVAPALMPVFLEEKKTGEGLAWRFASVVFLGVLGLSAAVAALTYFFPGAFVSFSAWLGGKTIEPEAAERLGRQVSCMTPAFVGVAASVVTYMVLAGYKRFFWAQSGETSMRLVMIASVVGVGAAGLSGSAAVRVLGLGVAAGSVARLITHFFALGKRLKCVRAPAAGSVGAPLRRFGWLVLPLLLGATFAQFRDFVNNSAVIRFAGEGLVSASSYGRGIYSTLEWLVPLSLGIAMFPYFCDLVDRNDLRALGEILTRSGRVLMLAFFALAAAMAVMSAPFAYLLFGIWKKMEVADLDLVAVANACYILVLPALALEKLVMQGFYSNRRMIAPTVLGIVFSSLSIGVSVVGIRVLDLTGAAAIAVVALGFVASRCLKTVALVTVLRRRVPMFPARETFVFVLKALAVAATTAGSAALVRWGYESVWPLAPAVEVGMRVTLLRTAPEIMLAGAVSIAAGLGAIKLLRMEELAWVIDWFRRKRSGAGRSEDAPGAPG
ncbi:MAG: lipid II flippase MurJ [Planctomycetota bacterium]